MWSHEDAIKDVDAGAAFGAGLDIGAGRGAIVIDVRFLIGMRDLSESSDTTFTSRTLAATFGYRF